MTHSKTRRALLLELLEQGELDVEELSRRFKVSGSTVRRDLQRLSRSNAITRTYGGAMLAHSIPELSLNQRQSNNAAQKTAIAYTAANLVNDDDVLFLDVGSTVTALGRLLRTRRNKVITNNLALVPVFAESSGVELIILGGTFRATSVGTIGPFAMESIRQVTGDKVFLGADGVVAGRGLCEASIEQTSLKSAMIRQSRDVVVLADASKLAQANQRAWVRLPTQWTLITDWLATDEQCDAFSRDGAHVIRAREDFGTPSGRIGETDPRGAAIWPGS